MLFQSIEWRKKDRRFIAIGRLKAILAGMLRSAPPAMLACASCLCFQPRGFEV